MEEQKSWFSEWFNSPYYHLLYAHRDEAEADAFIGKLADLLQFKPGQRALDLACGKGRHSRMLRERGLVVTGLDLSPESIREALEDATDDMEFVVGDMRDFSFPGSFDYIFNFFTSFGYFDSLEENLKVLKCIHSNLEKGGRLLIDFMNVSELEKSLVPEEIIERSGIEFHIHRKISDSFVHKTISFEFEGRKLSFEEKVQALRLEDFDRLLKEAGLKLVDTFGDYSLAAFECGISKRLIILAEKE